jgi:hypothetical protein
MQSMKGATSKAISPSNITLLTIASTSREHEQADEPAGSAAHRYGVREGE